jgi:hypothetical protein
MNCPYRYISHNCCKNLYYVDKYKLSLIDGAMFTMRYAYAGFFMSQGSTPYAILINDKKRKLNILL